MFNAFKKPMPLAAVVDDLIEMLTRLRTSVDSAAKAERVDQEPTYSREAGAFVYVLGLYAVQTSSIRSNDKHRLSAEITGSLSKTTTPGPQALPHLRFLQERWGAYRQALHHGKGRDDPAKIVFQFMQYLGTDSPNHVAAQASLYVLSSEYVSTLEAFLNKISKTYKFT